jgi:hypothetical protein
MRLRKLCKQNLYSRSINKKSSRDRREDSFFGSVNLKLFHRIQDLSRFFGFSNGHGHQTGPWFFIVKRKLIDTDFTLVFQGSLDKLFWTVCMDIGRKFPDQPTFHYQIYFSHFFCNRAKLLLFRIAEFTAWLVELRKEQLI